MAAIQRSDFGTLGRVAKAKLRNDNDIKIIIVGANSQTGIGKTTLAIQLCRFIDEDWNAERKAFIDVQEYLNAYLEYDKGSALLLDEIEHGADSRRAMSSENVELSQGWAKLRARNIATVATLPSISMLDKRMLELADYQVFVKRRGLAQPYKINVNDFKPQKLPQRKPLPGDEHIQFVQLSEDDSDKKYLDALKDQTIRDDGPAHVPKKKHRKKLKQREKQVRQDCRDEWFSVLYDYLDMTYGEIEELPNVDVSRQRVSQIVNGG